MLLCFRSQWLVPLKVIVSSRSVNGLVTLAWIAFQSPLVFPMKFSHIKYCCSGKHSIEMVLKMYDTHSFVYVMKVQTNQKDTVRVGGSSAAPNWPWDCIGHADLCAQIKVLFHLLHVFPVS